MQSLARFAPPNNCPAGFVAQIAAGAKPISAVCPYSPHPTLSSIAEVDSANALRFL